MAQFRGFSVDMARSNRRAKTAKDLRRRPASRSVPDRVLIVTEGSKTEPSYFKMLIAELGLTTATITIVGDGGAAPISVANEAENRLKRDDDFEQVYCLFDRDKHSTYDQAIEKIKAIAKRREFRGKVIAAIPSIPCFEVWYLFHVSDSRKPYENMGSPGDDLISDLKKIDPFKDYTKSECHAFFDHISSRRSDASKRAEKFLEEAQNEGAVEFHENPSTRVHLVVKALTDVARRDEG